MKVQKSGKDKIALLLSAREKEILFDTIALYPLVPASHHRLTKAEEAQSVENQRLLEESLAEQRAANRRHVDALLNDPAQFKKVGAQFRLKLSHAELDWLLQVFNDIRVGAWLALGEPDETKQPEISAENIRYAIALEVCGAFESVLLAALGETESSDWLS